MKKLISIITVLLGTIVLTSCLKSDLEELETYTNNDITGLVGVYHRYYGTDIIPGSGEVQVKQARLASGQFKADKETATCEFACKIPSNFPESEKNKFSMSQLVVVLNISSAALIEPIQGAPKLGIPGDWSKPNKYVVTAANGAKKTWTVTAKLLQ
ncbi:hypothetical protein [Bacteroides heparinolyticus]|uniref:DUF5018-related domain-containing protein n=1 Tax=Prevotella heparinolytica TaxID=28113 RepID=UPI0035A12EC0